MEDIRDLIFKNMSGCRVIACLKADGNGILSGIEEAVREAEAVGLKVNFQAEEGAQILRGDLIMEVEGTPKQICVAEDRLIGKVAKASGVATKAHLFAQHYSANARIVCGAWKKIPSQDKAMLRRAAETGGIATRITDDPMIYLDKNYVAIFGSVQKALLAVADIENRKKIVQVRGREGTGGILREAETAVRAGADIVYVDTGKVEDLQMITRQLKAALREMEQNENYRHVDFAFGGCVTEENIHQIIEAGADIIEVGRAICDAPLLDMKFDVTNVRNAADEHSKYNLLDKSELVLEDIHLRQVNLGDLSTVVAEEIGVDPREVVVIDVRDGVVALDVLEKSLDPDNFISKEERILDRVRGISGVSLGDHARVTSNGMLGWIAGDNEERERYRKEMERSKTLGDELRANIAKRVLVFPTGAEVANGEIEDTNTPLIRKKFEEKGYTVDVGPVQSDDLNKLARSLWRAVEMGYGVCITTGGVGAEDKDYSVEAILRRDPEACTPYIAKFQQGHGRHSKDGIRIGVGKAGVTTFIAMPGPNDEVSLCIDTVVTGISEGWSKEMLSFEMADILRRHLREKIGVGCTV